MQCMYVCTYIYIYENISTMYNHTVTYINRKTDSLDRIRHSSSAGLLVAGAQSTTMLWHGGSKRRIGSAGNKADGPNSPDSWLRISSKLFALVLSRE